MNYYGVEDDPAIQNKHMNVPGPMTPGKRYITVDCHDVVLVIDLAFNSMMAKCSNFYDANKIAALLEENQNV